MLQQRLPLAVLKLITKQYLSRSINKLQQRLPLAVLKQDFGTECSQSHKGLSLLQQRLPLAVLKLYQRRRDKMIQQTVATALTACGIETLSKKNEALLIHNQLQQRLPLAVLKHNIISS